MTMVENRAQPALQGFSVTVHQFSIFIDSGSNYYFNNLPFRPPSLRKSEKIVYFPR